MLNSIHQIILERAEGKQQSNTILEIMCGVNESFADEFMMISEAELNIIGKSLNEETLEFDMTDEELLRLAAAEVAGSANNLPEDDENDGLYGNDFYSGDLDLYPDTTFTKNDDELDEAKITSDDDLDLLTELD